ncbi:MAG TPA: hypothetical protein VN756_00690 [Solirubrobacterales bacterium]|nr:hypothetical protein [Solirubrobacterales bacterium]
MGVEVAAPLALAVEQQIVAVEDRVVAGTQDRSGRGGDQRRAAGGDEVETFMAAAAAAGRAELADGAAGPVRSLDWKDVGLEGDASVVAGTLGPGWGDGRESEEGESEKEKEKERVLQWCSMTRSTMLYSFASSAVMK